MPDTNPHLEEILSLLRRADCHYGNTLRDEEAGWTVEHAARKRNVQPGRIVELRGAVHAVADGQSSRTKARAGHEDGVLRALPHFRGEMSEDLRQHIGTRLARRKAEFLPDLKAVPLQCNTRGANQLKPMPSHERACECGLTHAWRLMVTEIPRRSVSRAITPPDRLRPARERFE